MFSHNFYFYPISDQIPFLQQFFYTKFFYNNFFTPNFFTPIVCFFHTNFFLKNILLNFKIWYKKIDVKKCKKLVKKISSFLQYQQKYFFTTKFRENILRSSLVNKFDIIKNMISKSFFFSKTINTTINENRTTVQIIVAIKKVGRWFGASIGAKNDFLSYICLGRVRKATERKKIRNKTDQEQDLHVKKIRKKNFSEKIIFEKFQRNFQRNIHAIYR